MNRKPVVYIAGPECFYENGVQLAKEALALCEKYGFEGISPAMGHPLGDEIDFSKGKAHAARQIFKTISGLSITVTWL